MLEVISKVSRNGHFTIPAKIRKSLHIKEGDILKISVKNNKIVIMPGTFIDKDQSYFFTEECQKEIKESEKNFKTGKYSSYTSAKALKREIESD